MHQQTKKRSRDSAEDNAAGSVGGNAWPTTEPAKRTHWLASIDLIVIIVSVAVIGVSIWIGLQYTF